MFKMIGRFIAPALLGMFASLGCGDAPSSGNTTAAVGHDGKEHGEIKAPAASKGMSPAQAKGAPMPR